MAAPLTTTSVTVTPLIERAGAKGETLTPEAPPVIVNPLPSRVTLLLSMKTVPPTLFPRVQVNVPGFQVPLMAQSPKESVAFR